MFLTRQVLIGVLGVPSAPATPTYNWIMIAGGASSTNASSADGSNATNTYRKVPLDDTATSTITATLSQSRFNMFGAGNKTNGIVGGGFTGSATVATVNIFTNSTETSAAGTSLSNIVNGVRGASTDSTAYGFGVITDNTGTPGTNRIHKHNYASTTSTFGSMNQRRGWGGCHNNATYNIYSGGVDHPSTVRTVQDLFTFSSETSAAAANNLTERGGFRHTATGDQTNSYVYTGSDANDAIYKVTISSGATAATITTGVVDRQWAEAAASDSRGVFCGGTSGTSGSYATSQNNYYIDWANDTVNSGVTLGVARQEAAAFSGAQTA